LITPEALEIRQRMSVGKNFEAFLKRSGVGQGGGAKDAKPMQRLVGPALAADVWQNDRGNAYERAALLKENTPTQSCMSIANTRAMGCGRGVTNELFFRIRPNPIHWFAGHESYSRAMELLRPPQFLKVMFPAVSA
jgi:hypothetical protein